MVDGDKLHTSLCVKHINYRQPKPCERESEWECVCVCVCLRERESCLVRSAPYSCFPIQHRSCCYPQFQCFFPPSAAVVPASFNWLIFWQRAGQIGEAGSISRAHQHPQEALSPHSCVRVCACVCVCVCVLVCVGVYIVIEKVPAKWGVGMDGVL